MKHFLATALLGITLASCAPQTEQSSAQSGFVQGVSSFSSQDFGRKTLQEYSKLVGRPLQEQLAYIKKHVEGEVLNDASQEKYGFLCQERREMFDAESDKDLLIQVMRQYHALQKERETEEPKNLLPRLVLVVRDERQLYGGEEDLFYGQTHCQRFREGLFDTAVQSRERTEFPEEVQGNGLLFSYDGHDPFDGKHVRYAYVFPSIDKPEEVKVYKYTPQEDGKGYVPELLEGRSAARMVRDELLAIEVDHILRKVIIQRMLEKLPKESQQNLLKTAAR